MPTDDFVDEAIAEDITAALERNVCINPDLIDLTVSDGRVTLAGDVGSWYERDEAINSAKRTLGVVDVDASELKIKCAD